ncbi:MAG: ABC transporter ATP-binding protein [Oscillospiraceae bacterium]
MEQILKVDNLYVSFDTYAGEVQSVRGVSFGVNQGEVLAIVGESGCGKSVTSQTIMKLNPTPPCRIKNGSINLCGNDIVNATEEEMQNLRGSLVSMIFQDPMTCLNPTMQVGKQLVEAIVKHKKISKEDAIKESIKYLDMVQIPNAKERSKQYPHQFSGGMRQRVMIAMALTCNPKLLIADEPTTALDVTIQAQIIDLLCDLKDKTGTSIIIITHDLGVVANIADRVAVMYAGKIVEQGDVEDIFYRPSHPYTRALLDSLPKIDTDKNSTLISIQGTPPDLFSPPNGCEFFARCDYAMEICADNVPDKYDLSDKHHSYCWLLHPECPQERNVK